MNVEYSIEGSVAFIQLRRPPVNSLNLATRGELARALKRAAGDTAVAAVVLWGGPDVFCAGADIVEFAGGVEGQAYAEPSLGHLIDTVESFAKPVIAAIAGTCIGGGLELALGCHYRLLASSAALGLPEIRLGLLPGAGGTQRLPRLIGVAPALAMILSGSPVPAQRAAELGIGRLAGSDLRGAAGAWAREVAGQSLNRVRSLTASPPAGQTLEGYFDGQRAALKRPLLAHRMCIDAVRAAVTMEFDAGIAFERECFRALLQTPESKALQYAFFGDRRARVVDGLPADVIPRNLRSVGVVGAGTMGTGIVLSALAAGFPAVLVDSNAEALGRAAVRIRSDIEAAVAKGRIGAGERDRRIGLLSTSSDYARLGAADLIIEAVFEDLAVKQQVFRELGRIAAPEAVLASNTSTLDIDRIGAPADGADRVIGLHFFSPANVMRLLEIVRGTNTSGETIATALAFARKLDKVAVVARIGDGFIGNRMFEEYLRQAYLLLEEGALPAQVDAVLEGWGMAMGPFAVMDLAGGDIGWAIRKRRAQEPAGRPYSKLPDRVCELGRFGRKSGAGYYRYGADGRRQRDPLIDELVVAYSGEIGLHRRDIPDEEIVARCVLALVNEGARLLSEGIAQRGSDIDVVYRYGYGFPAHRGGPMFYADEQGLGQVLEQMATFRSGTHGELWQPAALLLDAARRGARLSST